MVIVSGEYHMQFAGESTLAYFKAKTDYDKFMEKYRNVVPFFTYAFVIKGLHQKAERDNK